VEGGKGRNGNGPDQVWEEIDTPLSKGIVAVSITSVQSQVE